MVYAVIHRDEPARGQGVRELAGLQAAIGNGVHGPVLGPVSRDADGIVEARIHIVPAEDVAPHQAPALGDPKLCRDVADVRLCHLGQRLLEPLHLLHHHPTTLELGVGEVAGIGGIDLAVDARRTAPGQQHHPRIRRAKEASASLESRGDVAHAPHAKPQPGVDLLELEGAARRRQHVGVAAGVDHHVGQDGLATGLRLEGDATDAVAFDDGVAAPHVEQEIDPRLPYQLGQHLSHDLGIEGHGIAHAVVGARATPDEPPAEVVGDQLRVVATPLVCRRVKGTPRRRHPLRELLAEPGDDLAPPAVVEAQEQRHEPPCRQAAEGAVALHQGYLGSGAPGRHGGRDAGAATSHDQHLRSLQNGGLARLLSDGLGGHGGAETTRRRTAESRGRRDRGSGPDA